MLLSLRDELETSELCLVLMKLTRAPILTEALGEYGLTELTSGLQHQALPTVIGGLNVHGLRVTGVTDAQRPMSRMPQRRPFGELICPVIWTVRVQ